MVQAATIEAIVQQACREGCLSKSAILAAWPELCAEYHLLRPIVLRDARVVAGSRGVGGFRAAAVVASEVAETVREEGYLSKRSTCMRWRLSDRDYDVLRQAVLQSSDIESGGGRGGGFRSSSDAMERSDEFDRDLAIDPGIALNPWQRAAVELISEVLPRDQLRELVGGLAGTGRTAIRIREGVDRPSRKAELATALVLRHGRDLLRNPDVRNKLSRATNTPPPRRWHPGKAAALDFVAQLGLPIEFAGEPVLERKPDFEFFEPQHKPALRDFQEEVQQELLIELSRGRGRAIVTLPTGAGKTLVAVETIASGWQCGPTAPPRTLCCGWHIPKNSVNKPTSALHKCGAVPMTFLWYVPVSVLG